MSNYWYTALDENGLITNNSNILVWPTSWDERVMEPFIDSPKVDRVFFANGGDNLDKMRRIENQNEKLVSIDNLLGQPVYNYEVPELISKGELPAIDIEIARDPAMAVMYGLNSELVKRKNSAKGEELQKLIQEESREFRAIMEKVVEASNSILGSGGVALYDTADFGSNPVCSDWKLEYKAETIEEKRTLHIKEIGRLLSQYFGDVEEFNPENHFEFFIACK